jgi:hypothetical protein
MPNFASAHAASQYKSIVSAHGAATMTQKLRPARMPDLLKVGRRICGRS